MKLKLPLGGGKLLILSLNHLFNWFVWTADSFRNKASPCLPMCILFTLSALNSIENYYHIEFRMDNDTTVVGLISNRDETNYRSEVSRLARWCSDNNLSLNVEKTNEIVVDFRRVHSLHAPLPINGATVERVSSTKFLGLHITEDLSWTNNTAALAKNAQQRLYFLRKLRRARAPGLHHVHLLQRHHREHPD